MPGSRKRHGKKHRSSVEKITESVLPLADAVKLLPQLSTSTFTGTAEVHVRLGVDPTQSDHVVRSVVSLPHGTGKEVRVAAFVTEENVKAAKAAGALHVGGQDLIEEVMKGMLDFDIAVAEPALMKELGKVAKVLGPKGLMPNTKAGTVTTDPAKTVAEVRKGKIEFRADKQGIIHTVFGKLDFGEEKLRENLEAVLQAIKDAKPSSIKGEYIKTISISPTMGPGVWVKL
jgi:large subunit ribosomal protein L1